VIQRLRQKIPVVAAFSVAHALMVAPGLATEEEDERARSASDGATIAQSAPRYGEPLLPSEPPPPAEVAVPARRMPLAWNEEWPRARPLEYAAAVTFGAGALLANAIPVHDRGWSRNGLDEGVRDGLRLRSESSRSVARGVSDGLWYGLMAYPIIVDALLVAGPKNGDLAWQMFVIDAQSMALSGATSVLLERTSGRERPYLRECDGPGGKPRAGYESYCDSKPEEQYQSFISGHTLLAFTGAGLTCAHHMYLPLYGGGAGDVLACVVATSAATAQGALRVSSDRHYMTDVAVGAALGFGSGYALPVLLHYGQGGAKSERGEPRPIVAPYATASEAGLKAIGSF
jgi:membrane-associated phospholipid phosphatase